MKYFLLIFCLIASQGICQPVITDHNLPSGYTSSQLRLRNQLKIDALNNKWIAFATIGLGKYDGTSWIVYDSLNSGLPSNKITSVDFDLNGNMWAGTALGAVFYDGSTWQVYNSSNTGLNFEYINSVTVNGSNVWFSTSQGAVKFDGTNWTNFSIANSGIANDTVKKIIHASNGMTWLATKQGLSRFDGSNWLTFDTLNSILPVNTIFDITDGGDGKIWIIPNIGNSVFYVEADTIIKNFHETIFNTQLELYITKSYIGKDGNGNIYLLSTTQNQFIIKVNGNTFELFYFSPYTLNLGGAFGNNLVFDNQGTIWYLPLFSTPSVLNEINLSGYQVPPFLSATLNNSKSLDVNDVRALILNRGDMHWNLEDPAYEVPKFSGSHATYASALWIGGLDAGGNLHTATQSYRQTGNDYWPGPISGMSQPFDSSACVAYDKMYNVYKWEVEQFKTNFLNGSVTNGTYAVPLSLLEWPANGNAGITDDKAPFFDFNSNGLYNPFDGDYPLIKGDQMLFWMFNDSLATHSNTDTEKIGVEVHGSAYAYSCPGIADSNQVLNTTTLYRYRVINRSVNDYSNVYLGIWISGWMGNITDDYMGCDTTLAAVFVYNGDNLDDIFPGQNNYGLNPPMINTVFLKGMIADAGDGMDNNLNGIIDEPNEHSTMNHFISADGPPNSPASNPVTGADHYNYMQSKWLDGLQLTYGGDGRNQLNPQTNFMFSGTPFTLEWNEQTAGNPPEERTFLASSGPVSLASGNEISIDFAYVFTRDSLNPNGLNTSIARNISDIQRIKNWFDNDNFPGCINYVTSSGENNIEKELTIYPNPASDQFYLKNESSLTPLKYEISDVSGRIVGSGFYNFTGGIDINRLNDGCYSLKVIRKHSVQTTQLIKISRGQ